MSSSSSRDDDETALSSESSSSTSSNSHGDAAAPSVGKARGRRKRAQTYSFKPLPTPLFLHNKPDVAMTTLVESNVRTRGATFTARPSSSSDAPTETCELCRNAAVCCKITMKLKADDGDGEGSAAEGKKAASVTKLLCRRCALQQQEFAEKIRIVHDDDNRLSFLTAARKWSDLALQQKKEQPTHGKNP
jgi:hypothetical protein